MSERLRILRAVTVGVVIRLILLNIFPSSLFSSRIELSSPITSWERIKEGIHLWRTTGNPYQGDVFHASLLICLGLDIFVTNDGEDSVLLSLWLLVCDVVTALFLYNAAKKYLYWTKISNDDAKYSVCHVKDERLNDAIWVVWLYLLNPLFLLSFVAKSLLTMELMLQAALLSFLMSSQFLGLGLTLGISIYVTPTTVLLLVPIAFKSLKSVVIGFFTWLALTTITVIILPGFDFIHSTSTYVISITDLQPNIGLFWYFYAEMFDHFHLLFTCIVALVTFFTSVPISIKFSHDPIASLYIAIAIHAIYRPYPTIADPILFLSFLPAFSPILKFFRNIFLSSFLLWTSICAAPSQYRIWQVTFNPNFFYATTCVYAMSLMLVLSDVCYALCYRDYVALHGLERPFGSNNKVMKLVLT